MTKKGSVLLEYTRNTVSRITDIIKAQPIVVKPGAKIIRSVDKEGHTETEYMCPFCGCVSYAGDRSETICPECKRKIMVTSYRDSTIENEKDESYTGLSYFLRFKDIIDGIETDSAYMLEAVADIKKDGDRIVSLSVVPEIKWALYCQKDEAYLFCNPETEEIEKRTLNAIATAIRKTRFSSWRGALTVIDEGSFFDFPDFDSAHKYYLPGKIRDYYREIEEKKAKAKSKTVEFLYPDKFIDTPPFEQKEIEYDRLTGERTYWVKCTHCGHEFTRKYRFSAYGTDYIECPSCHEKATGSACNHQTYVYVKDDVLHVLNRMWDEELREFSNAFYCAFGLKKMKAEYFVSECREGGWKKINRNSRSFYSLRIGRLIEDDSDVVKYSGIKEYNDMLIKRDTYNASEKLINYISDVTKYPVLEKILKAGYINAFEEEKSCLKLSGDTLAKAFSLNKSSMRALKTIYDNDYRFWSCTPLKYIQNVYETDKDVSPDHLVWLYKHKVDFSPVMELITEYGMSVNDIVTYLIRVYENQCYEADGALITWRDYLHTAKLLSADLSDNHIKYPRSLKLEHDRMVMKFRIISDKEKETAFKIRTEDYIKRFAYENKDFFIKAPESTSELFNEGKKLCHCVGTYADRIICGTSCILFIRKKDEPDTPYYTCEVADNRIVQIRGLHNTTYKTSELNKFINEWKKNKSIA